mgnify:CR=1 FL=1|tara:strand:- start:231 stop:2516 length:2286 start_codon:yes stop_codon:yes gene_type:complete
MKIYPHHRPVWSLFLLTLLIVICSVGNKNLYFRGDYKTFFREDNPQRLAFDEMQAAFNKTETVDFLVTPKNQTIFTKRTLQLIRELTQASWNIPYSIRVNSVSNFQHTYSEQDDLIVQNLIPDNEELTRDLIGKIKNIATNEPDLDGLLVSSDMKVAVISVTVAMSDGDQTKEVQEISTYVRDIRQQLLSKYPEHDIYLTGVVMLNEAFLNVAEQDAQTLIPLMFASILILIALLLKSSIASICAFIVVAASVGTTMGIAGWLGYFVSMSTVNVPTMVMTLAVADCIHLASSFFLYYRQGENKNEALSRAIELNTKPIFITSVTTSLGFLTLNFSDVPALVDLGNLTAIGVMLACLFSLTLLPALLALLPLRRGETTKSSFLPYIDILCKWVTNHRTKLLVLTAIIFPVTLATALTNELNDVAIKYFSKSNEFRQAADFQSDHLGGLSSIDFAIRSQDISGINEPATLITIEKFSNWLRKQPEVHHVQSISDTYKKLNKNINYDDESFYTLPFDKELAAQYLLLYEMSLPYGLDINNRIDMDKSASRITVTLDNLGSKQLTGFEDRAHDYFRSLDVDLELSAASPALMFAHIGETNMNSMLKGSVFALLFISLLLIFALKSLRLGLISLIPNLLPASIGFGFWALISGEINMGLSVVLSMTLGIIVDDTVHFLNKYKSAKDQGMSTDAAVQYAYQTVGKALFVTTLVLSVGFGILSFSPFSLNSEMGVLTAIIIVTALVIDLISLPAFLLWLDKEETQTHS